MTKGKKEYQRRRFPDHIAHILAEDEREMALLVLLREIANESKHATFHPIAPMTNGFKLPAGSGHIRRARFIPTTRESFCKLSSDPTIRVYPLLFPGWLDRPPRLEIQPDGYLYLKDKEGRFVGELAAVLTAFHQAAERRIVRIFDKLNELLLKS